MTLWQLSALDAADKIRSGEISSGDLVRSCLDRISETDTQIGVWPQLDGEPAVAQGEIIDDLRRRGHALGSLPGIPVASALPVEPTVSRSNSSQTVSASSASGTSTGVNVFNRLVEAGSVHIENILGFDTDTEDHTQVRNPHNQGHAAGDQPASAKAAAAVSAGHVPLAVSLQSSGALISAASYCGIHGFKPTRGTISRRGCALSSPTLDSIGILGRSLSDISAFADALASYDSADPQSIPRPRPALVQGYRSKPPVEPCFAWVELPHIAALPDATRQGFYELIDSLGDRIEKIPAPKSLIELNQHHQVVHDFEIAQSFDRRQPARSGEIDERIVSAHKRAQSISEEDYKLALAMLAGAEQFFVSFFYDYDAIIAPAALAEATLLGTARNDAVCTTIWDFAGLPCLSAPWLAGETGLPVGVQLIGSPEEDDRLLRTAAWLERHLDDSATPNG